jgi:hypothetical protein
VTHTQSGKNASRIITEQVYLASIFNSLLLMRPFQAEEINQNSLAISKIWGKTYFP